MRKNIANQKIACQLISKTDGSDVTTGTTTVYATPDAGSQASLGTATHEGNGCWTIDTGTASNTNADHLAFTWTNTSAITVTQNVYTEMDANVAKWLGTAPAAPDTAGVPKVNMQEIAGGDVEGNNATLKLKALDVQNSAGDGVIFASTGSNGFGMRVTGHGTGDGAAFSAGNPGVSTGGSGISSQGGNNGGVGMSLNGARGLSATVYSGGDHGIYAAGGSGSGGAGIKAIMGQSGYGVASDPIAAVITTVGTPSDLGSGATIAANLADIAGSGFASASDSAKILSDKIDAVQTQVGAGVPVSYAPSTATRTIGSDQGGTVSNLSAHDESLFSTGENASTGLQVDIVRTTSGTTEIPSLVRVAGYYNGNAAHSIDVQLYNYTLSAFETVGVMLNRTSAFDYVFPMGSDHDDGSGKMELRFAHSATPPYNASHRLHLDWVSFEKVATSSALASDIAAIRVQTDRMQFTALNDVKATLDGEEVTPTAASLAALALEATAQDILTVATKLDSTMELDGAGPAYQFTADALDQAPAGGGGGGGLTQQDVADAMLLSPTTPASGGGFDSVAYKVENMPTNVMSWDEDNLFPGVPVYRMLDRIFQQSAMHYVAGIMDDPTNLPPTIVYESGATGDYEGLKVTLHFCDAVGGEFPPSLSADAEWTAAGGWTWLGDTPAALFEFAQTDISFDFGWSNTSGNGEVVVRMEWVGEGFVQSVPIRIPAAADPLTQLSWGPGKLLADGGIATFGTGTPAWSYSRAGRRDVGRDTYDPVGTIPTTQQIAEGLFDLNAGTYAAAATGSVVKEIVDNASATVNLTSLMLDLVSITTSLNEDMTSTSGTWTDITVNVTESKVDDAGTAVGSWTTGGGYVADVGWAGGDIEWLRVQIDATSRLTDFAGGVLVFSADDGATGQTITVEITVPPVGSGVLTPPMVVGKDGRLYAWVGTSLAQVGSQPSIEPATEQAVAALQADVTDIKKRTRRGVTSVTYTGAGKPDVITWDDGSTTDFNYDVNNNLTDVVETLA